MARGRVNPASRLPFVMENAMPYSKAAAAIAVASLLALSGCKFIKTADQEKEAAAGAFDPDKRVAEIWDAKVLPFLDKRAGALKDVAALMTSDVEAAGAKYGH